MKKVDKELTLQLLILFSCFLIIGVNYSKTSIKAQTIICSGPPLTSSTYPKDYAWLEGAILSVVIYNTPSDGNDFKAEGVRKWNGYKTINCSNVTINNAVPGIGNPPNQEPPDNTIWIIRAYGGINPDGGVIRHYKNNPFGLGQQIRAATISISPDITNNNKYPNYFYYLGTHETGHTFGIENYTAPPFYTVIMGYVHPTDGNWNAGGPKYCDVDSVKKVYCPTTPTPTPTPIVVYYPPPEGCYRPIDNFNGGSCPMGFASDAEGGYCCQGNDCREMEQQCLSQGGYWGGCADGCYSPIVIDILGNGYNLTDGENGIEFDLTGKGSKHKVSWTSVNSDDAWLVLDRNENGRIDSGLELFGNFTVQDSSISVKDRNGFLALAVFDKPVNGGNADGVINKSDTIFTSLQLWQDKNHNGISESNELHTLPSLDIETLELDYRESRRTDEHGNRFKYRAKVWDSNKAKVGRWAWDVFLLKGN